jgi:hypothetical protein
LIREFSGETNFARREASETTWRLLPNAGVVLACEDAAVCGRLAASSDRGRIGREAVGS